LPIPRLNALFVAGPRGRFKEIRARITELDKPIPSPAGAKPFRLSKQPASRVAQTVINFWGNRYPPETAAQNQIRVTWDDASNTVYVQAAPADMAEIASLIEQIDTIPSSAVNDLRIVPLKNALADELSTLLLRAIQQGIQPAAAGGGIVPGVPGAGGGGGA